MSIKFTMRVICNDFSHLISYTCLAHYYSQEVNLVEDYQSCRDFELYTGFGRIFAMAGKMEN